MCAKGLRKNMRAKLSGKTIFLEAVDAGDAANIVNFPRATRTSKMPPRTWMLPLCFDTVSDLASLKVSCDTELRSAAKQMLAAHKFIDDQKVLEHVEPVGKPPINEKYSLFQHQVRAFNIALALYGYEVR